MNTSALIAAANAAARSRFIQSRSTLNCTTLSSTMRSVSKIRSAMAKTKIVGFRQDPQADWIAELACGHTQHVRHRPPWQSRPWTQTADGRASRLGAEIECPVCDRAGGGSNPGSAAKELGPSGDSRLRGPGRGSSSARRR